MEMAGLADANAIDFWCTDKPCWGKNGTDYRMGKNKQVVGDYEHYGDYVYSQEAMRIISEHDLQVPLFFYIAFQCNHEPLEAPDEFIEVSAQSLLGLSRSLLFSAFPKRRCRTDVPGDLAHGPTVV